MHPPLAFPSTGESCLQIKGALLSTCWLLTRRHSIPPHQTGGRLVLDSYPEAGIADDHDIDGHEAPEEDGYKPSRTLNTKQRWQHSWLPRISS